MEKQRKFKRGMLVIIPKKLSNTRKRFTVNSSMTRIIGTLQTVSYAEADTININGWTWDPKDFKAPKTKEIEIKHFDPEELVT